LSEVEWIWPAWLCWAFPFLGAVLTPLLAKIHPKVRDYGAVFFSLLGVAMTVMLIPRLFEPAQVHNQLTWVALPGAPVFSEVKAGVIVDPLSIILANVVAIISFLIMVYSLGYMKGDSSLTRYWFFMNLFIGNMLLLVVSDNFIQFLFGWEGVGLCSYALIGYWYKDAKEDYLKCWVGEGKEAYPPSHCGMKAQIVTRAGDIGLLIGLFMIAAYSGTLNFVDLQNGAINKVPLWVLVPAAILLFAGPIGKSAQLPLMEWLPDAMAGPTTVSALIHAATMVNAGVYLVGRLFPILYFATWSTGTPNMLINFFYVVAWIGVITSFVSGTQAMASGEIKKVLAYSTVSQLGYMMIALGVGGTTAEFYLAYAGGLFHLASHAVFKAALFLTAGAVIHACESRFMRDMGGLRKAMPITFWSMLLTAFSLMGIPILFSGFWSKDMILEASLVSGEHLIFVIAVITVAITCFYSVRMLGLTFFGEKSQRVKQLEGKGHAVHEAPAVMWIPYALLAAATVSLGVAGYFFRDWIEKLVHGYLLSIIGNVVGNVSEEIMRKGMSANEATMIATSASLSMLVLGALPAYYIYVRRARDPSKFAAPGTTLGTLWKFLNNRWYVNRFYYGVFVYPLIGLSGWILRNVEIRVIDKFNYALANGAAWFSNAFRRTHTGILTYNVVGMIIGVTILLILLARVAMG
jgi:NADH-quinone oxidoreductase subunit L